jgi:hypothetical protein
MKPKMPHTKMYISSSRSQKDKLSLVGPRFRDSLVEQGFEVGDEVVVIRMSDFNRLLELAWREMGVVKV